jgi:LytS/YehU family sensor histidine kinase
LSIYLVSENIWPEAEGSDNAFTFNHIIAVTIGAIYVIGFVSALKLTHDWIYEKHINDKLKKLQLQTELNYLRTQIQPHFFFNTLNNLYALTLEKSDHAPEIVLKLSEIMEYVLYDMKDEKVSLLKEIGYLQSYLELEKLRYGDKIISHIDIEGDIGNIKIPPLIFITFIENSFKHANSKNKDSKIKINLTFELKGYFLSFTVTNSFFYPDNDIESQGIGIRNTRRRLDLLYGKNYTLEINTRDNKFIVKLKIPVE